MFQIFWIGSLHHTWVIVCFNSFVLTVFCEIGKVFIHHRQQEWDYLVWALHENGIAVWFDQVLALRFFLGRRYRFEPLRQTWICFCFWNQGLIQVYFRYFIGDYTSAMLSAFLCVDFLHKIIPLNNPKCFQRRIYPSFLPCEKLRFCSTWVSQLISSSLEFCAFVNLRLSIFWMLSSLSMTQDCWKSLC